MAFKKITIDEAKQKIEEGKSSIVDIRDINSYEQSHIENAYHVSAETFGEFCDAADKAVPLVVYCYHGVSSQTAAQYFVEEGFAEVYSIEGGFEAWCQKYAIEKA